MKLNAIKRIINASNKIILINGIKANNGDILRLIDDIINFDTNIKTYETTAIFEIETI